MNTLKVFMLLMLFAPHSRVQSIIMKFTKVSNQIFMIRKIAILPINLTENFQNIYEIHEKH